ncbi:DUF1553 domain-containing protein, partial [bacterium]
CHGSKMQMGDVRLDTAAGFGKGKLVTGNDPEKSLLAHVIRYSGPVKMPPSQKLKPAEIADLETWIKMGAPWPASAREKPKEKPPLWSLQPVKKPPLPKVKGAAWVRNPIDAFVLARLEAKRLAPAAAADRRALLRRATYDLTGLPPTAPEMDAFLADKTPEAYDKVVDRLLASPRYGERQARAWLDVARYADTKGYVFEEDRNYPNAYTYREWVIDAFNRDLSYDRFITQQLAADQLPEVKDADAPEGLAAMGFLTVGRRFLNSVPDIIDDRIDVTMRGFQGFTVACARCHDHKFDPIPTQDYYSLYGVFDSSEERTLPISKKTVREPWERHNAKVAADEGEMQQTVLAQIKRLRGLPDAPPELKALLQGFREDTIPDEGKLKALFPHYEPAAQKRLDELKKELDELKSKPPAPPKLAMAMVDRANPRDGVIFKRGNPGNPGDPAPRRFLAALSKAGEREYWKQGSGRLQLARAIASRDNPLTARVFVNRIWMGHFGAGLVRTPSDFGYQGEKPTHPELLDYLASRFMDDGWSVKKLHRLIVTSAAYRQSSDVDKASYNADPDNRLINRMNRRRLDLEQMRDTAMMASGRLDLAQTGGRSVDLWAAPFTPRRAVYGFVERQNLPGTFRTFDFATPDSTSARRFQTTVPQQALFFLNSSFAVQAAQAVAALPEVRGAKDEAQRIRRLYLRLFARLPDADEMAAALAYIGKGEPTPPSPLWSYGYGGFDGKKTTFTPLGTFVDGFYRVGPAFPDPGLGYIALNPQGGHPGRDDAHAAIRRWTAPFTGTVAISGALQHGQKPGNGVRARIVSSRSGFLGEWVAHEGAANTEVKSVGVEKGETLDFIVDPIGNDNSDAFAWAPEIRSTDGKLTWNATANFTPPPGQKLTRLALYAQALMMTNEFMFVD